MRLPLTRSESIELTTIITPRQWSLLCLLLLVRLGDYIVNVCEFVRLLFLQVHRETDHFFGTSGVHLANATSGHFHFRRTVFSTYLNGRVDNILAKAVSLRVNLDLDGVPIKTSRLLTSSLSLGVPVPRALTLVLTDTYITLMI